MPIVLQDSTVTGNTATGQDSNLLNFTKVMLKTDSARSGDADDDLVSRTSERDAGDASGGTSGRQLDSFVVTFDRPVDPSGPEFDAQGRLLIGTDGGIWSGAGDDLLIGGRTTFDCDTDITVAVGDMEASRIAAGTQLASVTDLIIDPFNPDRSAVHDVSITGHSDGGDNWEMVVKVLNAETGSPGDGNVRSIPPAVQQPEHESGLVWSGESGGINGDPDGGWPVMLWDNVKNAKPSASGGDESASQTGTVGGHFTQIMWADTHSRIDQVNPPSWGLDRIDQRASDAGTGKVSVHDISISKQCDHAGGVNALLGDGSVRHVDDAAAPFFAYGDDFIGGVSVAASDAVPNGRLYLATDVGVFEQGATAGESWGLDRIDQRDLPGGQGSVFDTSYDLLV